MKQWKKRLLLLLVLAAMAISPAISVFAASTPATVTGVKAKNASETSSTLRWNKVPKATGYYIYQIDAATAAVKKIGTIKKTSYTVKNLKPNTAYRYQIQAYVKAGGTTTVSAQYSKPVTVKTAVTKPSKPSSLSVSSPNTTTVQLSWKKAGKATGYYIYLYNEATKKYEKIGTTKSTSYKATNLETDKVYKFAVCSYRSVKGEIATSKQAEISGKAWGANAAVRVVHGRYFSATLRRNVTVTTKTGKQTLKKGTKVRTTSKTGGTATAVLKDGSKVKIKASNLRYGGLSCEKDAYSKKTMEAFVNAKGYSSSTRYLIWISQYSLTVNVFKGSRGNWSLVRSMPCIVGRDGKTPMGTFKLRFKDSAYGGVRIYFSWNPEKQWGNSFHRRVDGHTRGAYSSGCIRLGDGDLNFLNQTCPLGTTVISY